MADIRDLQRNLKRLVDTKVREFNDAAKRAMAARCPDHPSTQAKVRVVRLHDGTRLEFTSCCPKGKEIALAAAEKRPARLGQFAAPRATTFPRSEDLGRSRGVNGEDFALDFYGEDEGAAVVSVPDPTHNGIGMTPMIEVFRAPAADTDEARRVIAAFAEANGWRVPWAQQ
jgi:hypothetical protein